MALLYHLRIRIVQNTTDYFYGLCSQMTSLLCKEGQHLHKDFFSRDYRGASKRLAYGNSPLMCTISRISQSDPKKRIREHCRHEYLLGVP